MDLAAELSKKGEHKKAIALLDQAIAKDPMEKGGTKLRLYSLRSKEYMLAGDLTNALSDAQESVYLHPGDARSLFLRAQIFAIMKQDEKAIEDFNRAIAIRPLLDECFLRRGEFLLSRGKKSEALKNFEKAMLLNPGSDAAAQDRFEVLRDLGEYQKALGAADLYISLRPQYTKGYSQRARLVFVHKDYEQAIKDFTYAIEIGSRTIEEKPDVTTEKLSGKDLSDLYAARAEAYLKAGVPDKAKEDSAKAQELKATSEPHPASPQ